VEEALDPSAGPDDEAKAIGFDTFLDRVPQNGIKPLASVMDIGELKSRGFIVEAYTSGTTSWNDWNDGARIATPNFMSAQTVTWSTAGSSWTYSPIEYWPVSNSKWDKVSLFAYLYVPRGNVAPFLTFAPAKAEDVDKNPKLYYTMPAEYNLQVDLIVDAEYNRTGDADKVTFKFDHVLSRIGFKAKLKTDYAPATVTMSSLTFRNGGLRRTGTYTFNSGTGTGADKDNKAENSWNVDGGQTSIGYTNLVATSSTLSSTEPLDISGTTRYLMLIPQKNAYEQAYVMVSYTIDYPDGHVPPTETVSNERVYLPEIVWEPGIAYTYTLNIVAFREMTFHIEKDNWNGWGPEVPGDIFYP
jgi:hypothetical protein